ncbi:hypothetical protein IMZ48_03050 [Candidatus Bathyarchaeota archaeon]|nr:hypothetical protein [Candidatus Bathyarchaeota archaeon]
MKLLVDGRVLLLQKPSQRRPSRHRLSPIQWLQRIGGGCFRAVELLVRLTEDLALRPCLLEVSTDDAEILALEFLGLAAASDPNNL